MSWPAWPSARSILCETLPDSRLKRRRLVGDTDTLLRGSPCPLLQAGRASTANRWKRSDKDVEGEEIERWWIGRGGSSWSPSKLGEDLWGSVVKLLLNLLEPIVLVGPFVFHATFWKDYIGAVASVMSFRQTRRTVEPKSSRLFPHLAVSPEHHSSLQNASSSFKRLTNGRRFLFTSSATLVVTGARIYNWGVGSFLP